MSETEIALGGFTTLTVDDTAAAFANQEHGIGIRSSPTQTTRASRSIFDNVRLTAPLWPPWRCDAALQADEPPAGVRSRPSPLPKTGRSAHSLISQAVGNNTAVLGEFRHHRLVERHVLFGAAVLGDMDAELVGKLLPRG